LLRVPHWTTDRLLIVNGDDFGLSPGINRAIIEAHTAGIVTSASLMATGEAFEEAVMAAREHPELSVGLHLALIEGASVLAPERIPSLVGADGHFPPSLRAFLTGWALGQIRLAEIQREFEAQVEKALDYGVRIDKLDSHMHIHLLPGILQVVLAVARRYRIRWIRLTAARPFQGSNLGALVGMWKQLVLAALSLLQARTVAGAGLLYPDRFAGLAESGRLTEKNLLRILQGLVPGVNEVMVHPGYPETIPESWPQSRHYERERELTALLSPRIKDLIKTLGIKLINYREVDHHS
jgi:hopanoid biosynthesis associated protein HpnK